MLDEGGELLGLVSTRDLMFAQQPDRPVAEVMTPRSKLITIGAGASLEEARDLLYTRTASRSCRCSIRLASCSA